MPIIISESDILSSIDNPNSPTSDQLHSNFFSIMDRQYPDKNKPLAGRRKRKTKGTVLYVCRLCSKWTHGHRATVVQHIKNYHAAQLRPPPPHSPILLNQSSLPARFASIPTPDGLRQVFCPQAYNEAVIGLLTQRRAPFSAFEWEELKVLACNPTIGDPLMTSRRPAEKEFGEFGFSGYPLSDLKATPQRREASDIGRHSLPINDSKYDICPSEDRFQRQPLIPFRGAIPHATTLDYGLRLAYWGLRTYIRTFMELIM